VTAAEPGVRKVKASRSKDALKDAARRMFTERGYASTKVADIAAAAGRSIGVFYDHFDGKEAVLEALMEDFRSAARERGGVHDRGHVADHDLADPDQLREHVSAFWHTCVDHLPVIAAVCQASMVDARFAERAAQLFSPKVLQDDFERMLVRGATLPGDPALVASAVASMLVQFAYVWLVADGRAPGGIERRRPSDQEAVDTLTALVMHGISGPPGPRG